MSIQDFLFSPLNEVPEKNDQGECSYWENEFDFQKQKNNLINDNSQDFKNFYQQHFNEGNENNSFKNDEQFDNLNDNMFMIYESLEPPKKSQLDKNITNVGKTSATSFIGKKTKRSEERKENSETIQNPQKKVCGRKSKFSKDKGNHNKFSPDNMMRKIKSNFSSYVHEKLNNSFKNKKYEFYKLDSIISENLKKDYNEELMKRTFKDLYSNTPISGKYRKKKLEYFNYNKNIIDEIENQNNEEEKEFEVISILNRTYLDLFEEFRTLYLEEFLKEIKEKEEKKKESEEVINNYIEKIKNLCMIYKNWFLSKSGRIRTK